MRVRSIVSAEEFGAGGHLHASPALTHSHLKQSALGAAIGAVLVMAGGGAVIGAVGLLTCAVVGAMVGAVAAKSFAMYADDVRQDAYWRERPYADTEVGQHDRDRATSDGPSVGRRSQRRGLGEIAANPTRLLV